MSLTNPDTVAVVKQLKGRWGYRRSRCYEFSCLDGARLLQGDDVIRPDDVFADLGGHIREVTSSVGDTITEYLLNCWCPERYGTEFGIVRVERSPYTPDDGTHDEWGLPLKEEDQ